MATKRARRREVRDKYDELIDESLEYSGITNPKQRKQLRRSIIDIITELVAEMLVPPIHPKEKP